jgi:hypothetical protein
VAALLAAVFALLLLPRVASAQSDECSLLDPDCLASTTSTTEEETTTTEEETTTTEARTTTTREEVTTSTLTITTLHDVLIPGDGTAGAETTTTTAPGSVTGSSGISDETLIMAIVAALGAVAVIVAVLTWRYWHATRPRIVETPPARPTRSAYID